MEKTNTFQIIKYASLQENLGLLKTGRFSEEPKCKAATRQQK